MPHDFEYGSWRDPAALPEPLRRLHRRIQAQARRDRSQRLPEPRTSEQARWPGLVTDKPRRNRQRSSS
ncbi:MAG TPA: hypothetical protein VG275_06880 [Solirubrobacteraceae bacterium]|jgi:hypothetical protein|nr:hypothetical protein [Solirubrobacteraceae bacterium]